MSEHQAYRIEHDFGPMVDEIAAKIQHRVDQAALDRAADTLAMYGYVKVVRCRDCEHAHEVDGGMYDCLGKLTTEWDYYYDEPQQNLVEPDGFCAWAKRKEAER